MTTFEEDTLVVATTANVFVVPGDKGRVIETGTHEFHRVYWPKHKQVSYHSGSGLRRL